MNINQLPPEKRELLETLIAQDPSKFNCFPLSFSQQRLWFAQQLDPNASTYNISAAVRFSGQLNVTALHQSLNQIVQRHEILRTIFITVKGQPMQMVASTSVVDLPIVDLRSLPKAQQEVEVQRLAQAEAQKPFDLTNPPLLRVTLLHLNETENVLLLVMHHIISDGWSSGVLVREMANLYNSFSPLPELPIQYADFALWQRDWLQGEVLSAQLSYWQQQLSGSNFILELPTDYRRPSVQTFTGKKQPLQIPQLLANQLKALSQREGVTLFMTLLAAFKVLLYRYTNQEDIIVGTPIANRTQVETEALIGMFVNTLVLRTDLSDNPSFRTLLQRVRDVALGAYAHQDLPFEKLVEVVLQERDNSRHPLFQVAFALQNTAMPALEMPGLTLEAMPIDTQTAMFDLTLVLEETTNGIDGFIEYNTDLFHPDTIARMAGHFQTLLVFIVGNQEQRIGELPLLTASDYQLLAEWNNTQAEYSLDTCVHQLFEAQVEKNPDAVAVVCGDRQLTYRQLNSKANQLAHYLRSQLVRPEVFVGVYMERSIELVIALLGILKAGGAYVPLDPSYPQERCAFMLEDSQVLMVLSVTSLAESLVSVQVPVVCLDDLSLSQDEANLENEGLTSPNNLAYAIYTSGSTGKPKGVQIEHRGLVNLVLWHQQAFAVSPTDRATLIASPAFDASVWELYPYLCAGASIYIPDEETRLDYVILRNWLVSHNITITFLPTPLAERVLSLDWSQTSTKLRTMLVGGDKLHKHPAISLPFELVNNYGPTEYTVVTTSYRVPKQEQTDVPPAIGRAIANTHLYILDSHMQQVPIGVPGELYISGNGLARGYINRPDLTAKQFISNPFDSKFNRLYKTGDLVRYLPDGNIEFIGRRDNQVKIRGFRIELGEIEIALNQHPGIEQVVVVTREDQPGEKRLVAYITSGQEAAPSASELRSFLKQLLPHYAIPSAFVFLETMPLTANGKIDRRFLPKPADDSIGENSDIAPRTSVEEILVKIWAEVLGRSTVSIHDNFFELGGHSLLATQAISRVRDALQIELPLRYLFEFPTVATLSSRITAEQEKRNLQTPPLVPVDRNRDLPLSFAQQRLWFLNQIDPDSVAYNIPIGVRLNGVLHVEALQKSLNEIIQRHEILRTTFTTVNGTPVQVIAPNLTIELPIYDLQKSPKDLQETQIQKIALKEAQQPFNLATGPLLRLSLLRLSENEHVLLLIMHHIISDGWSMSIFTQELANIYAAFYNGKAAQLDKLPIQYADFASWQRQWLQGEVLEAQLAYWRQQLAGTPGLLQLPTDRPRPAVQSLLGATLSFELSPSLTEGVKQLSQQTGTTLFMTLLAAFKTLLWYYSKQEDISVGSPIANRKHSSTEKLIGFFVNTLVLRSRFGVNTSFRELLSQVQQVALGAYAHQDVPFEKLVEVLQPERNRGHSPLFQVWFVLQNTPMASLELPELTLSHLDIDSGMVRHDLKLGLSESSDRFQGVFEYKTGLFDTSTISEMVKTFETLLIFVVEQPDLQLATLRKMLDDAKNEQQKVKEKEVADSTIQKLKQIKRKPCRLG